MLFLLLLFLTGCGNDQTLEQNQRNNVDITKISTESLTSQEPSNKAKDLLKKHEEITAVKAVNSKDKLFIAIDIEHHERFTLADIRKKYKKEMKKEFKNMDVEFSTDKKLIIELNKLEEQMKEGSISNKELDKKIKKLIKLAKEQT